MRVHQINKNTVDVFLDFDTFPTGYEESCWIRLHKTGNNWRQIAGIRLPSYKYQAMLKEVQTILNK